VIKLRKDTVLNFNILEPQMNTFSEKDTKDILDNLFLMNLVNNEKIKSLVMKYHDKKIWNQVDLDFLKKYLVTKIANESTEDTNLALLILYESGLSKKIEVKLLSFLDK